MDRFEFRDGSSNKYWEVSVEGETLIVRYGKIGTEGQSKAKAFADAAAAEKERAKLIKEKTGKGYVAAGTTTRPVTVATPAAKSAIALPAAQPPSALPAAQPVPQAAPSAAQPAATAAPTLPEAAPRTSATKTKSKTSAALPTRLRPAVAVPADEAWRKFSASLKDASNRKHDHWYVEWPADLGEPNPGKPSMIDAAKISRRMMTATQKVMFIGYEARYKRGREIVDAFTSFSHWIVASCGGAFAMELAETQRKQMLKEVDWWQDAWMSPAAIGMRSAITAAPDAEYEAALAWSLEYAETSKEYASDVTLAFILADDRPAPHALKPLSILGSAKSQRYNMSDSMFVPLIAELPDTEGKDWRSESATYAIDSQFLSPATVAATVLATADSANQPAQPVLKWLTSISRDHYAMDPHNLAWHCGVLEARDEGALLALLPHFKTPIARQALDKATKYDPQWVFQACLEALSKGHKEPLLKARAMELIDAHGIEATKAWAADAHLSAYFEALTATTNSVATLDQVPAFLVSPPWRARQRAAADIVLQTDRIAVPYRYDGPVPQIREAWGSKQIGTADELIEFIQGREASDSRSVIATPNRGTDEDGVLAWLANRLNETAENPWGYRDLFTCVHKQPDKLSLMLWSKSVPLIQTMRNANYYEANSAANYMFAMLARFGDKANTGIVQLAAANPVMMLLHMNRIGIMELAPIVASALLSLKKAKDPARRWLLAHPRAALMQLLPAAVGRPGPERTAAEFAVRFYKSERPEALSSAMAEYSALHADFDRAIAQVLNRDPFAQVQQMRSTKLAWPSHRTLIAPTLKSGGTLPEEAMTALLEMLSFINPQDVYAGVPALKDACTADSLAAFAWSLFEAWSVAGMPSKEVWAFRALGWFGDDECARKLTKLIRKWPGEAAHARAVTGLDVLTDMGSDVALMNLNGIAEKLPFKGLQNKAREKIQLLAEARGLTAEELADRLVPDLDLDERGGLDLDFGPRQFRVGFDEFLKPWVKDAAGKRLKDLPKPIKSDDAAKGAEAAKQWAALKKDARAVASLQLLRLETMLATGRRAQPATFHVFFAAHPLVRHLAQRLVWGVYASDHPDSKPNAMFRVTEDLGFTDANDDTVEIDISESAEGYVGLVHPLHMSTADKTAWGTLFGDYEIAQPFAQLGRETYALTDAEKSAKTIERFKGAQVHSKRLRGLSGGWRTGQPQDGGGICWVERMVRVGDKVVPAALHFEDGLYAGAASEEPEFQNLTEVTIGEHYSDHDQHKLGDLDAITASEILRTVVLLVEASKT